MEYFAFAIGAFTVKRRLEGGNYVITFVCAEIERFRFSSREMCSGSGTLPIPCSANRTKRVGYS